MPEGLDVIVVDDDPSVCELISTIIKQFYTWGEVLSFTKAEEAIRYCLNRDIGVAIFVVDVFLGGISGFSFLDAIEEKLRRNTELVLETAKQEQILPRQAAMEMATERVRKAMHFRQYSLFSRAPRFI